MGKDADEIARAERTAVDAEEAALKAEQQAAASEPVAEKTKSVGELLADIIRSGVKEKATAAFDDNSKLALMTQEEREAAAAVYEQIAQMTSGANQEAGRLYNLERAKFLRGEVDRIAPTLPIFKIEKGL